MNLWKFDQTEFNRIDARKSESKEKAIVGITLFVSCMHISTASMSSDFDLRSIERLKSQCESRKEPTGLSKLTLLFFGDTSNLRCKDVVNTYRLLVDTNQDYQQNNIADSLYRETLNSISLTNDDTYSNATKLKATSRSTQDSSKHQTQSTATEKTLPGHQILGSK